MISSLYILIPLMPLLAAIIIALAGHRLGESSRHVGMMAIGISFVFSVIAFVEIVLWREPVTVELYQLFQVGNLTCDMALYLDQLTVLLLLLVTGVSLVVHAYSSSYMIGDERYSRFFALLALFTFAMVTLVMSSNLLMIFVGWELMGVCSYLLISHQSDRKAACDAATKAFLVNAVADVGLLFGIVLAFATFGTLDVHQIMNLAPSVSAQTIQPLSFLGLDLPVRVITLITLSLFVGCLGKSAQIPFHIWLPKAMEAPTPVSALIHAATMVNAGPFLLIRLSPLVLLSPVAMTVIAMVGGVTALTAAVISLTQSDIKKSLAYSTISQIGFMVMTCGLGAFGAAVFHLLAHGLLKAYLFLSTGSQLDADSHHGHGHAPIESSRPPWSLYAGALLLSCGPPIVLFSGPYESLWTATGSPASGIAFSVIGLLTVFFTAMYCVRGVTTLFSSRPADDVTPRFFSAFHLRWVCLVTLMMAACLWALWHWLTPFLSPVIGKPLAVSVEAWRPIGQLPLIANALLFAVAGWAAASVVPARTGLLSLLPVRIGKRLYVLSLNQFHFDEVEDRVLVRPVIGMARWIWRVVDVEIIDGIVLKIGRRTVVIAALLWRWVDVRGLARATEVSDDPTATDDDSPAVSARPIRHQLLIQILWLVAAITLFYWLVLYP